jgi:hypothetical protein
MLLLMQQKYVVNILRSGEKNDFFNQATKFVKLKLACKPKKQQLDNKAELGWS